MGRQRLWPFGSRARCTRPWFEICSAHWWSAPLTPRSLRGLPRPPWRGPRRTAAPRGHRDTGAQRTTHRGGLRAVDTEVPGRRVGAGRRDHQRRSRHHRESHPHRSGRRGAPRRGQAGNRTHRLIRTLALFHHGKTSAHKSRGIALWDCRCVQPQGGAVSGWCRMSLNDAAQTNSL